MKAENNYDKLKAVDESTSPLPKDEPDIPTRAIPIDPDAEGEPIDKTQVEAEVEIEKHGVPVIDVERPPVPDVHTDPTKYKKVEVKRKTKKADKKRTSMEDSPDFSLSEDREMKAYAEKLHVPKRKSVLVKLRKKLYDFYCKMQRFALNRQRKKFAKVSGHYHEGHRLPDNVKTCPLKSINEESAKDMGRERWYKREDDRSSSSINMVRNKKTGVVVATSNISNYKRELKEGGREVEDYEVVESQIKDSTTRDTEKEVVL